MPRISALAFGTLAIVFIGAVTAQAGEFGTAEEAKAMLNKAVTEVRADEQKALAMFNSAEGGFKDRDLYVLCANASDGRITASPSSNGKSLKSFPAGRTVMETAAEGKVNEITYMWPRPGSITRLRKHTFYTKIGDQICGVGYWE